jgi:hypothetical protein
MMCQSFLRASAVQSQLRQWFRPPWIKSSGGFSALPQST